MNIYKVTKNLIRKYKGKITHREVIAELEYRGYDTVFFNTKKGDMVLKAYGLEANGDRAFTYCGATRIVFVDENLHQNEKLNSLLHELGHVLMGHFDNMNIVTPDVRLSEMEAEAFAYNILYPQKPNKANIIINAVVLTTMLFFGTTVGYIVLPTLNAVANEYVYITSTGTKYHRPSCIHANGKYCAALSPSEASKCFMPCLVCNP